MKELVDIYINTKDDLESEQKLKEILSRMVLKKDFDFIYFYELSAIYRINRNLGIEDEYKNRRIKKILTEFNLRFIKYYSKFGTDFYYDGAICFNEEGEIAYVNLLSFLIAHLKFKDFGILLKTIFELADSNSLLLASKPFLSNNVLNNPKWYSQNSEFINNITFLCFIHQCFDAASDGEQRIASKMVEEYWKKIFPERQRSQLCLFLYNFMEQSRMSSIATNCWAQGVVLLKQAEMAPFTNYGYISLLFYEIVEIEIKQWILLPVVDGLNRNNIFEDLKRIIRKTNYKNNWIEDLQLGNINFIFREYIQFVMGVNNDYSFDTQQMFQRLRVLLYEPKLAYYLFIITHDRMLKKYRNPPAHTEPLNRNDAVEAKKVVKYFLLIMSYINAVDDGDDGEPISIPNYPLVDEIITKVINSNKYTLAYFEKAYNH